MSLRPTTGIYSSVGDIGNETYLKLIVHSKSVLIVYFILILVTFMLLGEIIYNNPVNQMSISKNTQNGIYAAIVIAGILNMLLIFIGMRTRRMSSTTNVQPDQFGKRKKLYGNIIYTMFTIFQLLILILTIVIFYMTNPQTSTSRKGITLSSIIFINIAIIIYVWAFAMSRCDLISRTGN